MKLPFEDKYIALAGVCQSASLVQSLARKGELDSNASEACISSILVTQPDSTQQVYGALNNLKIGFNVIANQLDGNSKRKDAELTRYVASILSLERKLTKHSGAMSELAERVSHVQRQLAHVDFESEQIISNLAAIYSDIVSPLAPKIQVSGNADYLKIPANQKRVRALLLAGVRGAVLWRQLGGQRRQILFQRNTVLKNARTALRLIN